jgi:hypothetical protein
LRHVRLGRDGAELTTRSYAGGIALFLRWCARTGRHWHDAVEQLGLFITWLRHAGPEASGADVVAGGQVLAGPGTEPVRSARRVNAALTAVRGFVTHAVDSGQAPARLMPLLYELVDERDLPKQARGEEQGMAWRLRARHRLHEPRGDGGSGRRRGDRRAAAGLPLGAGPAGGAVDCPGRTPPRRAVRAAPCRRSPAPSASASQITNSG